MSNVYSLADLIADLDREFAPVEINLGKSKVVLRNIMRLDPPARQAVMDAAKVFTNTEGDGPDFEAAMESIRKILRTAADTPAKAEVLVNQIGDDLALGMKIVNLWMEATQPGEASNSPA